MQAKGLGGVERVEISEIEEYASEARAQATGVNWRMAQVPDGRAAGAGGASASRIAEDFP
jgi:hypothetical protein